MNLAKLRHKESLHAFIRDYLWNRKVVYQTYTSHTEHEYSKGCPLGPNSGHLYWNLIPNTILELEGGVEIQVYNDDKEIVFKDQVIKIMEKFLNSGPTVK